MTTTFERDITERKRNAMGEWAEVLTRSAHDVLERMDTTLTLAEAKIALIRELAARRRERAGE